MNYGVDRYKRPQKISLQEEKARQKSREEYLQSQVNMLWRTLPKREEEKAIESARRYLFRTAGEPAVLYGEERPAARTVAARDPAHRA